MNKYFLLVTLGEGLVLSWVAVTAFRAFTGLSTRPSYALGILTACLFMGTIFEARYNQ